MDHALLFARIKANHRSTPRAPDAVRPANGARRSLPRLCSFGAIVAHADSIDHRHRTGLNLL